MDNKGKGKNNADAGDQPPPNSTMMSSASKPTVTVNAADNNSAAPSLSSTSNSNSPNNKNNNNNLRRKHAATATAAALHLDGSKTSNSGARGVSVSANNPFDAPIPIEIDKFECDDTSHDSHDQHDQQDQDASFITTPIAIKNPFDSPPSQKHEDDDEQDEGVVSLNALSQTKRRLEDLFQNEQTTVVAASEIHNDYSQYADVEEMNMNHQQQPEQPEQAAKNNDDKNSNNNGGKEDGISMDIEESNKNKNKGVIRTTGSTVDSSLQWDENESYHNDEHESNEDPQHQHDSSRKKNRPQQQQQPRRSENTDPRFWETAESNNNQCKYLFLKCLHRTCHPHIHPPLCCISNINLNNNHNPHLPQCLERIPSPTRQIICRTLIILFMILTISFVCLDLLILHQYLHVWLDSLLAWLSSHPVGGSVAFIGIFIFASLCFFPNALLSLGAGYVYIELYGLGLGIFVAFVICYVGCLIGAAICFARSRYLMRRLIVRFSAKYPIIRAVDQAFLTQGFRLFLLLRLSPAMPYNALNYIGGITSITFKDYWWASVIGISPGLLWTIFVGATFGTVNARGVDGNKEFDSNSVRRGVVLGLGIGLGVMGLIGTGIYARRELTKIVIEQQRERDREEHIGAEMSHHLMNEECEAIQEERDYDDESLSFEDLEENPQELGEINSDLNISNVSSRGASPSFQRKTSYLSESSSIRARQRPWTPEAVAAELPIIPKFVQRYMSPLTTMDSPVPDQSNSDADGNTRGRNQSKSASMPPMTGEHSFSLELDEDVERGGRELSPRSAERRRTLQHNSPDNMNVALVASKRSAEKTNRPRSVSVPIDDEITTALAHIDETRVLSDDESPGSPKESDPIMTPIGSRNEFGNRRRCNTDPASIRHVNTAIKGELDTSAPSSLRKKRQQTQTWTPTSKKGLKKNNSFGSFGGLSDLARNIAPSQLMQQSSHSEHGGSRPRSRSMGMDYSPSGHHLELDLGDMESTVNEDAPDREWFWIWA